MVYPYTYLENALGYLALALANANENIEDIIATAIAIYSYEKGYNIDLEKVKNKLEELINKATDSRVQHYLSSAKYQLEEFIQAMNNIINQELEIAEGYKELEG